MQHTANLNTDLDSKLPHIARSRKHGVTAVSGKRQCISIVHRKARATSHKLSSLIDFTLLKLLHDQTARQERFTEPSREFVLVHDVRHHVFGRKLEKRIEKIAPMKIDRNRCVENGDRGHAGTPISSK